MKRILIILAIFAGFLSCQNQDVDFPDYKYTTGYFPYQYPVRTLLLGNDIIYDNSNDNAHKFVVSVAMGGVYKNTKDRTFTFSVDNKLCDNVLFKSSGNPVRALPSNYYSLSSNDKIVIQSGNVNGGVEVQLTDAFFNDPDAYKLAYVLPLKLTGVNGLDSLLNGTPSVDNPDPRVSGHWNILPKDFTMFAVKFRNPYDGTFLHRGITAIKSGSEQTSVSYHKAYVEQDDLRSISTSGKNQVSFSTPVRITGTSGNVNLLLNFPDGSTGTADCSITGTASYQGADDQTYSIAVSGSGRFIQGGESGNNEEWGGKKRDVLYLSYQFTDTQNNITCAATDTLVLRDRSMAFETYELLFP
jgi:hypothetical protein